MNLDNRHIGIELLAKYFSGEATPGETLAVEEWVSVGEENRKEFDQLQQVWELIGKTRSRREIDVKKEWIYLQSKIRGSENLNNNIFTFKRVFQVAASIVLLLSAGWFVRQILLNKSEHTRIAEIREILLPDGSEVTLNAGSRITYPKKYGEKNRQVLLTGEAYFEVKKDISRPFIVTMNEVEIEVLGTSFNVKAYKDSDKIEVIVTEGKVSLYEKSIREKCVVATMGEKAVFDRNQKVVKKTVNANQNYMAWKTLMMFFNNDNLSTVVETIGQVYHCKIILKDEKLNACTLTTRFEGKDLETVLRVLESTLDITIEQEHGNIYISGEGCE